MITVFVWNPSIKPVGVGHAAMSVDATYVSWWPEQRRLEAHPFRARSFDADVAAEKRPPDHRVILRGLDECAIKDWWQSFGLMRDGVMYQGPLQSWNLLERNCSTVVATGLRIGGGDKYANWSKPQNSVWTPNDALQYARSIEAGLRQGTSTGKKG